MSVPTICIIDDDPAVLHSLSMLIEGIGMSVEAFHSAESFLAACPSDRPACLVVDVRMPGMSGLELLDSLVHEGKTVPTIFITGHGNIPMSVRAIKAGAKHFLEKPYLPDELIAAIREVIDEESSRLDRAENRIRFEEILHTLSDEELAVLAGIARGKNHAEIAAEMDVSLRTVQFRSSAIRKKLGVASRSEVMDLIFSVGWHPPASHHGNAARRPSQESQ